MSLSSLARLKNLGLGFDSRDYFSHPRPRDSGAILFLRIALPNLTHFWFYGINVLLSACHVCILSFVSEDTDYQLLPMIWSFV